MNQQYAAILGRPLGKSELHWLDLTANNVDLQAIDRSDPAIFTAFIFNLLKDKLGIGGWLEKRIIYDGIDNFTSKKIRNIHLGVDIWAPAGTEIFSIDDCEIYGVANNASLGDYGPTLILKSLASDLFYLFGHLSLSSLEGKIKGQNISKGQKIAEIGNYPINGNWPPHLHFQVMNNMLGQESDFPGVCSEKELKLFKEVCLNPYPFLGFD